MKTFEIHITGDKHILAIGAKIGIKTIAVDLLKPDLSTLRTEYMTSIEFKCERLRECILYVNTIVDKLEEMPIQRIKIESPPYPEFLEQSMYIESHYYSKDSKNAPLSINQNKIDKGNEYIMATERTSDKSQYENFIKANSGRIVEIGLIDSNVKQDQDWFDLYR